MPSQGREVVRAEIFLVPDLDRVAPADRQGPQEPLQPLQEVGRVAELLSRRRAELEHQYGDLVPMRFQALEEGAVEQRGIQEMNFTGCCSTGFLYQHGKQMLHNS